MTWRETWRQTVESFMRELRGSEVDAAPAQDAVVRAIAEARAAVRLAERELLHVEERLARDEEAAEACRRRRELADRIGDAGTAAIAERFERRHRQRVELLRRKSAVLHDEHALARGELAELLELARGDVEAEAAPADWTRPGE